MAFYVPPVANGKNGNGNGRARVVRRARVSTLPPDYARTLDMESPVTAMAAPVAVVPASRASGFFRFPNQYAPKSSAGLPAGAPSGRVVQIGDELYEYVADGLGGWSFKSIGKAIGKFAKKALVGNKPLTFKTLGRKAQKIGEGIVTKYIPGGKGAVNILKKTARSIVGGPLTFRSITGQAKTQAAAYIDRAKENLPQAIAAAGGVLTAENPGAVQDATDVATGEKVAISPTTLALGAGGLLLAASLFKK